MFGLMTEFGRVVSKPRGSGYAVRIWLENDGDVASQNEAAMRAGVNGDKHSFVAALSDEWRIYLYLGDDASVATANCVDNTILVTPKLFDVTGSCMKIDKSYLRKSGAISVNMVDGIPLFEHSRDTARNRPWGY